jgi:hypothetical protein
MYMIWEYFYNNSKCDQGEREREREGENLDHH